MTNHLPSATLATMPDTMPEPHTICAAPCCHQTVTDRRICEDCFLSSAIVAALSIERDLEHGGKVPGSPEMKALLEAGAYNQRVFAYYQRESPLGRYLSHEEAMHLRSLTDALCIVLARGGHQAMNMLQDTQMVSHFSRVPRGWSSPAIPRTDVGVALQPMRSSTIVTTAVLVAVFVLALVLTFSGGTAQ